MERVDGHPLWNFRRYFRIPVLDSRNHLSCGQHQAKPSFSRHARTDVPEKAEEESDILPMLLVLAILGFIRWLFR